MQMNSITDVTWLPAHPSHGSMSMWKYWGLLDAEVDEKDRYQPQSIFGSPRDVVLARGSKLERAWTRKVSYPFKVQLKAKPGVVHILDHSWLDLVGSLPKSAKIVVTVHDLIPIRYPGELSSSEVERFKNKISKLSSVDAVIAVSEYTKREIIDLVDIPEDRIFVVPNGVSRPPEGFKVSTRNVDNELRVGSVGSVLMRKNLEVFPAALKIYKETSNRPITLVRAGLPLHSQLKKELVGVLGADGLEEWGRVSDAELEKFYQSIDVMVVPSLYEGFGLPVLEAMARGIPVISSGATSLPEVGGDAALYFDPKKPETLADLLRLLNDSEVYEKLRTQGLLRSKQYSWRKTLEGVYSVYDKVLNI